LERKEFFLVVIIDAKTFFLFMANFYIFKVFIYLGFFIFKNIGKLYINIIK